MILSNYSFENDLGETTGQAIKNYKDYSKKISKTLTAFNQKIETYEKNKNEILAKLSKFGKLINENERIVEQLNKKGTLLQELNQDSYHKHISNYLSKVDVIKRKILFVKNSGELDKINISAEVLYFHTIKPFDNTILRQSVSKTKKLISVEELSAHDGLFNLCLKSCIGIDGMKAEQLAIKDFLHSYGSYKDLCETAGLTSNNIIKVTMRMMEK